MEYELMDLEGDMFNISLSERNEVTINFPDKNTYIMLCRSQVEGILAKMDKYSECEFGD